MLIWSSQIHHPEALVHRHYHLRRLIDNDVASFRQAPIQINNNFRNIKQEINNE